MHFQIPFLFILSVLFLMFLSHRRNQQTRNQQEVNRSFLERERMADNTRKQDISGLDFLDYNSKRLPLGKYEDEALKDLETYLAKMDGKRIINLTKYSNTDLKLMYGPANLKRLTKYDDRYFRLSKTLALYAQRHEQLGHIKEAAAVYEYAMELKVPLSQIYISLAKLYQAQGTPEKIDAIRQAVSSMDEEAGLASVLQKLDVFEK